VVARGCTWLHVVVWDIVVLRETLWYWGRCCGRCYDSVALGGGEVVTRAASAVGRRAMQLDIVQASAAQRRYGSTCAVYAASAGRWPAVRVRNFRQPLASRGCGLTTAAYVLFGSTIEYKVSLQAEASAPGKNQHWTSPPQQNYVLSGTVRYQLAEISY